MRVTVAVMDIREVPVAVDHCRMAMSMDMRLARRILGAMDVAVVLVMNMGMFMGHRLVVVLMHMPLGEMQIDTEPHQRAGDSELQA